MSSFEAGELMETKHMVGFRVFFLVIFFYFFSCGHWVVFWKFLNELHGLNSDFAEVGAEICIDIDCVENRRGGTAA